MLKPIRRNMLSSHSSPRKSNPTNVARMKRSGMRGALGSKKTTTAFVARHAAKRKAGTHSNKMHNRATENKTPKT